MTYIDFNHFRGAHDICEVRTIAAEARGLGDGVRRKIMNEPIAVERGGNGERTENRRTAWLIERTSVLWGYEWFCAGIDRWTKDPNKAICFPDQASAKEVWFRLSGEEDENKEFPYIEQGEGDWEYTMSITEHLWI